MTVVTLGAALALTAVSGALVVRRPRHPVSRVLAVVTVACVLTTVAPDLLVDTLWALSVLPLTALLIAFPDGPRGPLWTRVYRYAIAAIAVVCVLAAAPGASEPLPVLVVVTVLALSMIPVAAGAVVSLVRLWSRSEGQRRARIGLVLSAGAVLVVPYLTLWPIAAGTRWIAGHAVAVGALGDALDAFYAGLAFTLVPVAVGVSMLLEPVGRRWAWLEAVWPWVFAAGTALVVGGTTAEVAQALGVPSGEGVVAVSCLAVALSTTGVVRLLATASPRWTSPDDRALQVLEDLRRRLDTAPEPDAVPALVTATVGAALGLRGAALDAIADGGRWHRIASWGSVTGDEVVRPLQHGGEPVGQLVLVPHPDGVPIDLPALEPLLPSVAATVAATGLAQRLTAAYQRMGDVRDSERSRLRADLHDELSPALSGVRLSLHTAHALVPTGEAHEPLGGLLARAERELGHAGSVIRGILHDLRPDDLAQGGLVAAIRSRAADFDHPGRFSVSVDAVPSLPALAPAVEIAALRVASEALGNAARHSGGSRCQVTLAPHDDGLVLTIRDDGGGFTPAPAASAPEQGSGGVGLPSIATRAAAAGGWLTIGPADGGGTSVTAWFPGTDPSPMRACDASRALEHARAYL